jgi:hypothetical protein
MKKTFRPWEASRGSLFPPAPKEDLLPGNRLSGFIRDLVRDELNPCAICAHHGGRRGGPP